MLSFLAIALYTIIDVSHATDACGCNATAITGFDLNEYLGIWQQITTSFTFYEIFERSFPLCIFANYSANADGTVSVTNTGYNSKGEKDVARGTATHPRAGVGSFGVCGIKQRMPAYTVNVFVGLFLWCACCAI